MPSNFKVLSGASGEPNDPNFKNVTLLLHGDGSNGAQNNTFIDSSTNNFTITRNGNTTQGSFSPYGSNWSNYFDGNGDYLYAASNAAFGVGTGDFTIECWVFPIGAWTSGGYNCLFQVDGTGLYFGQNNAGFGLRQSGTANIISYGTSPTLNTWTHVAIVRSGTTVTMYYNGVSVATATSSANFSSGNAWVGADAGPSNYYNGYISNLRLVKGTAVYTANFTPPTAPLTAITNTSLLTCADNRFRDGSTNNFTITRNGDVKVTNFSPFAPSAAYSAAANGGSAYFDGSDWLSVPDDNALDFGTGDFTIETWAYFPAFSNAVFAAGWTTGEPVTGWSFGTDTTYGFYFVSAISASYSSVAGNSAVAVGAWNHVAVVRSGGSVTIYVNGVGGTAVSNTQNITTAAAGLNVGRSSYASNPAYFTGYLSNLRIVKGTAVYTSNFTPPTAPVTAISGTSLLTNFTNAAILDNSGKNDLETVGNAQISTSVKKFGTGSMYFDGTGDYLIAASSDLYGYGTGDFTIEFWLYISSVSVAATVFSNLSSASGTSPHMYLMTDSTLRYYTGSTDRITSGTLSTGQWMHVALCRASGSTRLFINGTQSGSTYTDSNNYGASNPLGIGTYWNGTPVTTNTLNGYLDDVRVTKGVARYTANFTAPTAPFPNK